MLKHALIILMTVALTAVMLSPAAIAQEDGESEGRDPAFEQEIYDRLAEIDPAAVPLFQQATEALDAGELADAQTAYRQVLELAPDFPDALRRLSYVEAKLGNVNEGLELAERAFELDPTPYNEVGLAQIMLETNDPARYKQALEHAQAAADALPEDPDMFAVLWYAAMFNNNVDVMRTASQALLALEPNDSRGHFIAGMTASWEQNWAEAARELQKAQELGMLAEEVAYELTRAQLGLAVENEDIDAITQAADKLIELAPEDPLGHFFAGLAAAEKKQWVKAERELLLARDLGWPADQIDELLDDQISSEASKARRDDQFLAAGLLFGYVLVGWVIGMIGLLLVGMLLSRITLATVRSARLTRQHHTSTGELMVRAIYRRVIDLASLYYYLSIPLLAVTVIVGTGAIFYGFFAIGRIPIRCAFFLLIAAAYTLYALGRSLTARAKQTDPGRSLPRQEAPELWALAENVAARLGTRPIDTICITSGNEIAVTEQGGIWQKLRDRGRRILIVGMGVLPGLTQNQFQAILAHEYGHFSHRDTAGGTVARRVRYSMIQTALALATNGQATWYNPVWLFLYVYERVFLRITLGASRLQEILADRYAAMAYGGANFCEGLQNIIHQTVMFDIQVDKEIKQALKEERDIQNLWLLPPIENDDQIKQVERQVDQIMSRPRSPYDSHPAPKERIELTQHILPLEPVEANPASALNLLPDPDALQKEMTDFVQRNVVLPIKQRIRYQKARQRTI